MRTHLPVTVAGIIKLAAGFLFAVLVGWTQAVADARDGCQPSDARFDAFFLPTPSLSRSSEIIVYLPPGYHCSQTRRYPVFYFNDGQQLFDWSRPRDLLETTVAAEIAAEYVRYGTWRLAAQLDRAVTEERLPAMIIVGIASENGPRARDLVPVPWAGSLDARGTEFGEFVASDLVEEIDRRYRTRANRYCRGIAGSSLGGVSALQIGLAHPREFGFVLSLSPVLGDRAIADHIASLWTVPEAGLRSTILVDFDIGPVGDADMEWMAELIEDSEDVRHLSLPPRADGASHTIDSWAERVIPDMEMLIGRRCAG
jgi:enterochelin esterase-like enzyme